MDQNNFNYQQPWMQQPMPPQKPSNGWIKWVVIGVIVVGLLIALVLSVAKIGKNLGNTIGNVSSSTESRNDSISNTYTQQQYESLLERLKNDSANYEYANHLIKFKNATDSIIILMKSDMNGFNELVKNEGTLSLMDRQWGNKYFVQSGRATFLKNLLISYRETSIEDLPPGGQNEYLRNYLRVDDLGANANAFLKEFSKWESMKFNQPVLTVRLNMKIIRQQVRSFEREILGRYDQSTAK